MRTSVSIPKVTPCYIYIGSLTCFGITVCARTGYIRDHNLITPARRPIWSKISGTCNNSISFLALRDLSQASNGLCLAPLNLHFLETHQRDALYLSLNNPDLAQSDILNNILWEPFLFNDLELNIIPQIDCFRSYFLGVGALSIRNRTKAQKYGKSDYGWIDMEFSPCN